MSSRETAFLAFNRGLVSKLALARVDISRLAFSAEIMDNWVPRTLGSMMLRPGLGYLGSTRSDLAARFVPFIFSTDDLALVELTDLTMRVWVNDVVISRVSVSSVVTNGAFNTDLTGWTDSDEAGGTSTWQTGGYMGLTGDGTNAAIRDQQVTVAVNDRNKEHALRIIIQRGPVTLKVGSTSGGDEYVTETKLDTGAHSLAFTPSSDFYIRFMSTLKRIVLVDSVAVESAGVMTLPAPWAYSDLRYIRTDQSGDIIFVACKNFLQRKIERRGTRSWSLVYYLSDNGPFLVENATETTLTAAATSGNTTLTASRPVFQSGHVGALFRITASSQRVSASIAAANVFTGSIKVTAVGEARRISITISGTWSATITLQRSIGDELNWEDVGTYTTNTSTTYADGLDNQIVYYRIGIKTGQYTSGTANVALNYTKGGNTGVGRVTGYTSPTVVSVEVLKEFGNISAEKTWAEGSWSTVQGFPSAAAFYEGRLWWAGKQAIWGSVSDDYYNFDPNTVGDSGPINRTIGAGPIDDINWLMPLQRLIVGAEGAEFTVRSTNFDEPLSPSNFNLKASTNLGSNSAIAVKINNRGIFVQRNGIRVYELSFSAETSDFEAIDLSTLIPEIGEPQITNVAVQRMPDTRVHCIRSDGTVALLVYNPVENVLCWVTISTDGLIEDAVVLPGTTEDTVYYVVNRTVNGSTVRYLEKWALETEARGGTGSKIADAFVAYNNVATTTITGLSHLEGKTVVVWGNGKDLGTKVVASGQITDLKEAVTTATVGLPYTAPWKSAKLAHMVRDPLDLTHKRRIAQLGVVLAYTHAQGLKYGASFDVMDNLPLIENAAAVGMDTVHTAYDEELIEFPGEWNSDGRLCLQAAAPRPCTVLAGVIAYESSVKR